MTVSGIFTTPPQGGRCEKELETFALLERLGISYSRVEHDPANTIADCEPIEAALGVPICKNLFLCNRQKTEFYLLAMPGDKPFQTKEVSRRLEVARLSFAPSNTKAEVDTLAQALGQATRELVSMGR